MATCLVFVITFENSGMCFMRRTAQRRVLFERMDYQKSYHKREDNLLLFDLSALRESLENGFNHKR